MLGVAVRRCRSAIVATAAVSAWLPPFAVPPIRLTDTPGTMRWTTKGRLESAPSVITVGRTSHQSVSRASERRG